MSFSFSKISHLSRPRFLILGLVLGLVFIIIASLAVWRIMDSENPTDKALKPVRHNAEWEPQSQQYNDVEMVLVPVGCFTMGSTDEQLDYAVTLGGERRWFLTETPAQTICFDKPFWIDKYEVTNAQYGSVGCTDYSDAPDEPRNCVNWFDAEAFCANRQAHLPTETEWEYAARGPDSLIFPWGNEFNSANVVFTDSADGRTASVGSRAGDLSWVGAFDMAGNVAEWTNTVHPALPNQRVMRGGSYQFVPFGLRSAFRNREYPDKEFEFAGFRCVHDFEQ